MCTQYIISCPILLWKIPLDQNFVYLQDDVTEVQQLHLKPHYIDIFLVCYSCKHIICTISDMGIYHKHTILITTAVIIGTTTLSRYNCVADS